MTVKEKATRWSSLNYPVRRSRSADHYVFVRVKEILVSPRFLFLLFHLEEWLRK